MKQTRSHTAGTVIGILLTLLLLPVFILNCYFLVRGHLFQDTVVRFAGYSLFLVSDTTVTEGVTEAEKGDLALAKTVKPEDMHIGDLIAYSAGDRVVIGKISAYGGGEEQEDAFLVRSGQEGKETVAYLLADQVIGAYLGRNAFLGKAVLFLDSTFGTLLVVGVPLALLLIISALLQKRNKKKQEQAEFFDAIGALPDPEEAAQNEIIPLISEEEKKELQEAVTSFNALSTEALLKEQEENGRRADPEVAEEVQKEIEEVQKETEEVRKAPEEMQNAPEEVQKETEEDPLMALVEEYLKLSEVLEQEESTRLSEKENAAEHTVFVQKITKRKRKELPEDAVVIRKGKSE